MDASLQRDRDMSGRERAGGKEREREKKKRKNERHTDERAHMHTDDDRASEREGETCVLKRGKETRTERQGKQHDAHQYQTWSGKRHGARHSTLPAACQRGWRGGDGSRSATRRISTDTV
eukprot:3941930-Rhodomonas_salina.22